MPTDGSNPTNLLATTTASTSMTNGEFVRAIGFIPSLYRDIRVTQNASLVHSLPAAVRRDSRPVRVLGHEPRDSRTRF